MGGKHNKCCCGPGPVYLFVGHFSSSLIYKINAADGTYSTFSSGVVSNVRSLSYDPTTDLLYVTGSTGNIYCLNSAGALVWSTTKGGGALIYDACVSNDGYVYVAFSASGGSGAIYKLDAATGTEITSGWPCVPGGGASFEAVCVDQAGNIYAGGDNTARTVKAISFTSAGGTRWTSNVRNVNSETSSQGVHGMAVDSTGSTVLAMRTTSQLVNPTLHSHYLLDATNGALLLSNRPTNRTGVNADGCDFSNLNDAYSVTSRSSTSTDPDVYKNLTTSVFNTGMIAPQGLVCTRDGGVYVVGQPTASGASNYNVWSVTGGWKIKIPTPNSMYAIESTDGRMGAFGL